MSRHGASGVIVGYTVRPDGVYEYTIREDDGSTVVFRVERINGRRVWAATDTEEAR